MKDSTTTLGELFPGNMGRVLLSAVALKLRRPALLKLSVDTPLEPHLAAELRAELEKLRPKDGAT